MPLILATCPGRRTIPNRGLRGKLTAEFTAVRSAYSAVVRARSGMRAGDHRAEIDVPQDFREVIRTLQAVRCWGNKAGVDAPVVYNCAHARPPIKRERNRNSYPSAIELSLQRANLGSHIAELPCQRLGAWQRTVPHGAARTWWRLRPFVRRGGMPAPTGFGDLRHLPARIHFRKQRERHRV